MKISHVYLLLKGSTADVKLTLDTLLAKVDELPAISEATLKKLLNRVPLPKDTPQGYSEVRRLRKEARKLAVAARRLTGDEQRIAEESLKSIRLEIINIDNK